jgi:hypothetical protein
MIEAGPFLGLTGKGNSWSPQNLIGGSEGLTCTARGKVGKIDTGGKRRAPNRCHSREAVWDSDSASTLWSCIYFGSNPSFAQQQLT